MTEKTHLSTKETILSVSAKLFAKSEYNKVTMREIGKAVGINPASIYYYFPSKADILKSLYDRYSTERLRGYPNLNELLSLVEMHPPHEVLMKSEYHFDEDIRETLDQILATAAHTINTDPESERFIRENIFDSISSMLKPLLQQMVTLGKIKPFDIERFIGILSFYCYGAAALNNTSFRNSPEQYQADLSLVFSIIAPVE